MKVIPGNHQYFVHHDGLLPLSAYTNKLTFENFLHVFERFVVEKLILDGVIGELKSCKLASTETPFAESMGYNYRNKTRIECAKEFFDIYQLQGKEKFFSDGIFQTEFYKVANQSPGIGRAKRLVQMYDVFSYCGGAVPTLEPRPDDIYYRSDFPWCIQYFDYQKQRDGSHRRMIFSALGFDSIPSIIVNVNELTDADLQYAPKYVRDNFIWFIDYIEKLREDDHFRNQNKISFNKSGNVIFPQDQSNSDLRNRLIRTALSKRFSEFRSQLRYIFRNVRKNS